MIKLILILIVLDFIFISYNLQTFKEQIFSVQNEDIQMKPFGIFLAYFFIIFLLYWFIIKDNRGPQDAFILGSCSYGIYAFTVYSIFNKWEFNIAIMDTLWGGGLFALTTYFYQL